MHPATGQVSAIQPQFSVSTNGSEILFLFDQPMSGGMIDGCAVFAAGGSTFRLPYRIAILPGIAN
jgi:hypothetical protein